MIQKLFVLAALCSSTAFAATPILTKTSASGSMASKDYVKTLTCSLYDGKVTIAMTYGMADGSTTTVSQDVTVNLQSNFMNLVKQAMSDKVETSANDSCGYATTNISTGDGTMLFDSGGCGKPHYFRSGGATAALMEIIGTYCTKTFN